MHFTFRYCAHRVPHTKKTQKNPQIQKIMQFGLEIIFFLHFDPQTTYLFSFEFLGMKMRFSNFFIVIFVLFGY